ncbi:MAG TPA: 5-(carboxyamino)imidazole ribonucleotide mutase [Anaerolineaceae bacterium]|nr:5-(carboxyamino)imidazole ribonucleotide mutase [Anaerolineaceae bacterium]
MMPLLIILMGSKADLAHAQKIAEAAKPFGFEVEIRIGSAHKTASHVLDLLNKYELDPRPKVYVTIAGRSNALSGFTDGCVSTPVITCPPPSEAFGGADIYSSLRMPSGIAPALVLEPANAALLAAKMIGIYDPAMRERVKAHQAANQQTLLTDDLEIQQSK